MKYLEEPQLNAINSVLNYCEVGDRIINGSIETFSCKKAGTDKKLAKALELQYQSELANSPALSSSPIGSMADASTRKVMINLISTMNACFPDYDFRNVGPEQFVKEAQPKLARNSINTQLAEMVEVQSNGFLEKMWKSIDEVIRPDECDLYSYIPDMEADPFSDGTLWSFNYFFYNKSMKKILYFTCVSKSKMYMLDDSTSSEGEDDQTELLDTFSVDEDSIESMEWEDGV